MKEHHLEVVRTARYHTLGSPGPATREVWVVLHGYRQLARRFLRRFTGLDDGTRWIVAPEALSRFYVEGADPAPEEEGRPGGRHGPRSLVGGTWMTREDREREIRDYVGYLDRLAHRVFQDVDRERVRFTLLGFSQGLHTAARWATLGATPPDRLILWGDYLPPDLDMEAAGRRLPALDVVLVLGEEDRTRRPDLAGDQERRLAELGVSPRQVTYPGGHEIDGGVLAALARETDEA